MEKANKFLLPKPDFSKKDSKSQKSVPHYLTPSGMTLLPRDKQPPPMYGPKGSTIPSRFLVQSKQCQLEPPQERHFCEPCEMELQTMDDFRRHRSQHERCPVDGCKYKAHPSVMDKHVTDLHASGIFDKIKKISTPEEIAAWREERRRKYPTLANTQMRQLAKEQRQRRGERLEENKSRFGCHEDRKRARVMDKNDNQSPKAPKKRQHPRKNRTKDKKHLPRTLVKPVVEKEAIVVKETKQLEAQEETISNGIRMFEGTSKLKDYKHEKTKNNSSQNVLVGLLGMYGSDNEDHSCSEEEGEEEDVAEEIKINAAEENMSDTFQECQPNDKEIIKKNVSNKETTDNTITNDSNPGSYVISVEHVEAGRDTSKDGNILLSQNSLHSEIVVSEISEDKNAKESSDEAPEEAPIERATYISHVPPAPSHTMDNKSINSKLSKLENPKKSLQSRHKYGLNYRKVRLRKQNTMLEKLLEPDIRHERNVLLQCVRFVCQNDFFGIGKKNNEKILK